MPSISPWKAMAILLLQKPYSALGDNNLGAIEEALTLPNGFSPRFFEGAFPAQPFARRQDSGVCPSGGHSCAEIGKAAANNCCPSDKYCYYKADWEVGCCGFGTTCDPKCTSTSYRTNATVSTTTTFTGTTSDTSATGVETVYIPSAFITTFEGCVARACQVSQYQCPSSMGGGCCDNTQICASNKQCLATISTTPTLVATRGCSGTASATDCPSGGGCCIKGQTCVAIDGTLGCSGTPDPPAGANVTTINQGLSQGAKAGIGAGIAVGAAIVIGALTWFCLRRRREARTASARTRSGVPTPGPESTIAGGGEMSEASGPSRGRRHQSGLVYQYLGPNAVPGPYTQEEDTLGDPTPSLPDHGVPNRPQDPSDIRPPVEIADSSDKVKTLSDVRRGASTRSGATTGSRVVRASGPGEQDDPVYYELEAPFPEPSPLSPDELPSAQSYHTPMSPAGPISPPGGTMRTDYLG